ERRFELATAQTPAQAWWPLDHASSTASVRSGRLEPAASTGPSVNAPAGARRGEHHMWSTRISSCLNSESR
ncbi:MAG: hypothetical protein FWF36_04640, partial [Propionibacteriaceae bacterium]|nr:hypothetical protein [Propionibacteriaceae bacterium]